MVCAGSPQAERATNPTSPSAPGALLSPLTGREVTALGLTRAQLIAKGMIWRASNGSSSFTVPLFDDFMRRRMPLDI